MTDESRTTEPASLTFGEAIAEMESILRRLEAEDVDVDQLAQELQRAAALLEVCRGKIRRAEIEVEEVVKRLEADEEPPAR